MTDEDIYRIKQDRQHQLIWDVIFGILILAILMAAGMLWLPI